MIVFHSKSFVKKYNICINFAFYLRLILFFYFFFLKPKIKKAIRITYITFGWIYANGTKSMPSVYAMYIMHFRKNVIVMHSILWEPYKNVFKMQCIYYKIWVNACHMSSLVTGPFTYFKNICLVFFS